MKPRVLLTRALPLPEEEFIRLQEECDVTVFSEERQPTREELRALLPGFDGLLALLTDAVDRELLEASPRLRVVSNYAVGFNNVDVAAATELGIAVTNTPGVLTNATADMAWALLMAVTRRIVEADAYVRNGLWQGWSPDLLLGMELSNRQLGIVGCGRIGLAIAKRARAFDMRVLYTNRRRLDKDVEDMYGLTYTDLDTLLAESDVVNLSLPYSAQTHHLIDRAALRKMKRSAYLINTARGSIVDEAALVEALRKGWIAGAGLDVFEKEPEVHPGLLALNNVVLAPHLGSSTRETRRKMAILAVHNLRAVLRGEEPPSLVNPEVWKTRRLNKNIE
jgi:glyoxylate reductase